MEKIKEIIYEIGIVLLFIIQIVYYYTLLSEEFSVFVIIVMILTFYSTGMMVKKIIQYKEIIKSINNIIYDNKNDDEQKIRLTKYIIK